MPQLDATTFVGQIVWLVITFVGLYLLMTRVAMPRISEVLEARQQRIAHDLDAAATLKDEAEAVLAEYEKAMAKARSDAQEALAGAAEERAREAEARHAELAATIAKQIAGAEERIAAARDEALAGVEAIAADIAHSATEKLVGDDVDEATLRSAVAAAKGAG